MTLKVHPRLRTIELRRACLIGLAGLILGGGMALFALWRVGSGVGDAWQYQRGVPAAHSRLLKLRFDRSLLAQVHGTVSYTDAHGGHHQHELSILRVLVTPEPNDALDVRYAPDDPSAAVTSWEYDSLPHELLIAALSALLSGLVLAGAGREVRVSLNRISMTAELATSGELAVVDLLDTRKDDRGFRVMLRYRYRTPSGAVLEGSIASSEGGAYRVDESDRKSLALLSRDGQRGLLLTRSGYPLLNASEHLPTSC